MGSLGKASQLGCCAADSTWKWLPCNSRGVAQVMAVDNTTGSVRTAARSVLLIGTALLVGQRGVYVCSMPGLIRAPAIYGYPSPPSSPRGQVQMTIQSMPPRTPEYLQVHGNRAQSIYMLRGTGELDGNAHPSGYYGRSPLPQAARWPCPKKSKRPEKNVVRHMLISKVRLSSRPKWPASPPNDHSCESIA